MGTPWEDHLRRRLWSEAALPESAGPGEFQLGKPVMETTLGDEDPRSEGEEPPQPAHLLSTTERDILRAGVSLLLVRNVPRVARKRPRLYPPPMQQPDPVSPAVASDAAAPPEEEDTVPVYWENPKRLLRELEALHAGTVALLPIPHLRSCGARKSSSIVREGLCGLRRKWLAARLLCASLMALGSFM